MIGAGATALGLGIAGYAAGFSFAVLIPIVAIPLNWWFLVYEEKGLRPAIQLPAAHWLLLFSILATTIVLEWALA